MARPTREAITVRDHSGAMTPARLLVCACGCRTYLCYMIVVGGAEHPHLQCTDCGTTYCDGACGEPPT
jgi:hypothetical protein